MNKPKVLLVDIETSPVLGYVWGLFDNNLGLNQVKQDWFILSFAAKWLHDPVEKVIYEDQSGRKNIEDDSKLLKKIWKLLDEADVIITQNGKRFDAKKLNARFILNGMKPPSEYKHIDTCEIARRHFAFTSNKLEYLSDKLCTKYKKLKHSKFSGFELWKQCLAGNPEAWQEMKKYNIYDILSLEELYLVLSPWHNKINFNLFHDEESYICNCGSKEFQKRGFSFTSVGKFQRFQCQKCGAWSRGAKNLLSKEKKESLRRF